ncbi:MAG: A24 family peptidase [Bryobacteraceae bacterium]
MSSFVIGSVFALVIVAAVTDVRTRRIPNLLTLPALVAGLAANAMLGGVAGLGRGAAGVLVAVLVLGGFCWFRTMGFGDLKLCAAVGAWIGPGELLFALLITAMAGGVMAVAYALWKGKLGVLLDRSANIGRSSGTEASAHDLHSPGALAIPYAPAIAFGVIFSFFAS